MANSSITITFNSLPALNTGITVYDSYTGQAMAEIFKESRTGIGESECPQLLSKFVASYNYADALGLDYNNTSLYTIVNSSGVVTITANNPNSQFSIVANTTSGAVTSVINNVTPPIAFSLDSVTISEASINPCDKVKLTITTNEQADNLTSPISQVATANPIVVDVARQDRITVSVKRQGITRTSYVNVPKLISSFFIINVLNTPALASIKINTLFNYTPAFTLEYSLDNTNWQTSTSFYNLSEGNYTLYIRDNIGCTLSIAFTVDAFTPNLLDYDGVAEVSNLNPIRFKDFETWSDDLLKTPYNTLSYEEDVKMPNNSFTQPFTKTDLVITQIKTNYSDVSAKIIDNQGNETALLVNKKTANMNINDVRDAEVLGATYNSLNYVAVKFSGGNTYDPVTLAINGDYNVGTAVPSWMNAGDYVNIQGAGWYKVLEVVYSVDAYVLVLNSLVSDFPLSLGSFKITSVYNSVDYERYEFETDFTTLEGYYQVQINLTDSTFGIKTYLSEWLNIRASHPKTYLIKYYNTVNNEINYNTGFVGVIRVPYADTMKWKPNADQDIYVTDTKTISLESKYRAFYEFSARPLPTMMAEKLSMILLQDRLFINTVNYLKEGDIESKPVGDQYQIKANLVKSDYAFDSNSGLGIGEIVIEGKPLAISQSSTGGFLLVE